MTEHQLTINSGGVMRDMVNATRPAHIVTEWDHNSGRGQLPLYLQGNLRVYTYDLQGHDMQLLVLHPNGTYPNNWILEHYIGAHREIPERWKTLKANSMVSGKVMTIINRLKVQDSLIRAREFQLKAAINSGHPSALGLPNETPGRLEHGTMVHRDPEDKVRKFGQNYGGGLNVSGLLEGGESRDRASDGMIGGDGCI